MKKSYYIIIVISIAVLGILFLLFRVNSRGVTVTAPVAVATKEINESNEFYTFSVRYPDDPRDTRHTMRELVEYRLAEKREEWKIGGQLHAGEVALSQLYPDRPLTQYQLDIDYTVSESKKFNTVSYVMTMYEFTGGAHGNTSVYTFSFGPQGYISIDSILTLEKNAHDLVLTKMIADRLPDLLGEYFNPDMMNDGLGLSYLASDGVTLDKSKCKCDGFLYASNLQHFVILDEGISFIFGQYDVAPYVAGMPEVTLSWAELKQFLRLGTGFAS